MAELNLDDLGVFVRVVERGGFAGAAREMGVPTSTDGGKDEPHLKEVIAWTYETFKDFDIRAMWIGGHSWGAMYTTTYVCKPELMDRVKGTILMSTNPTMPACADRISVINTNAD